MTWLSYIVPQTILRTSSKYNRDIRVVEENGKNKLLVNGSRESGEYIRGLWSYAFKKLTLPDTVRSILVLGVAGGTVIHILSERYPNARITGVDIDETMIDIGKKYFGLSAIQNLACICTDGRVFKTEQRFDLIIIDLFIGPRIPSFVESIAFQKKMKRLLTSSGVVIINYLRQSGYERKVQKLEHALNNIYTRVSSADRYNNRFFLGGS